MNALPVPRPTPRPGARTLVARAARVSRPSYALALLALACATTPSPDPAGAESAAVASDGAASESAATTSSRSAASDSAAETGGETPAAGEHLLAAVGHPERPEDDRARDADRHPASVLAFFGVEPGMAVMDLMAGGGYYTEILSRAVGDGGRVACQNSPFVLQRFAEGPLSQRLARPGLENVVRVDQDLDALELEPGSLDAALMVLFYHDTFWQEIDRARMNQLISSALRPGGVYGIVDHRAEAGSGERDVKTLHRVDETVVRREIEAAGFVFEAESELLSHPEDDRTRNVFDDGLRGKTDRFVYRFRKPK